jgi:hypothetical protein
MFMIGALSYLESIDPTGLWRVVACILFIVSCLCLVLALRWINRIIYLVRLLLKIEAHKQQAPSNTEATAKGK